MTATGTTGTLRSLADTVLMPCFDGTTAPDWLRRRVSESLGAVCLFGRNVRDDAQVRALTDVLLAERAELVVAIDEEAGDVTRLDASTGSPYPGNAALGRVDDVATTRSVGARVGARLRAAGVTLNFAPSADLGDRPDNPVIGTRAFGADPDLVARHTVAFVRGQQDAGVAACAKHFPGHGGTSADTHLHPAVIAGDLAALENGPLRPFRAAVDAGVATVMAGHLSVPAVDPLPASISARWLTEILRGDWGFDGVIVTDALEMQALAGRYGLAGSAVLALAAGADLLCIGGATRSDEELSGLTDAIVDAVRDGTLPADRLADAARRVSGLPAVAGAAASRQVGAPVGASGVGAEDVATATRAVTVAGPLPRWAGPGLLLRCEETPNIAVGVVPWGPGAVRGDLAEMILTAGAQLPVAAIRDAGTVVVITRDRHRHRWMRELTTAVRTHRPDAVLLEMGVAGVADEDVPALATYGATRASTQAALRLLGAGTDGTEWGG
ncbi:glycoside hydrolase family 3 N-terminal domain-containing protein [Nakamurella sp. A5-74]|uniref:Glycoside hydrolase family 3 N-terminal domain-containing protein n=1 Tax=Nakamurella sp. A5-74 TaxID=3158264 RepID=A0AAU8DNU9_9ACTN